MIKNPPSIKLNSFHYPNIPKAKPPTLSPYEKEYTEELNDTILKTQNKVSDINRNLSDAFNNISTKTKGNRSNQVRSLDEVDADYLFDNFDEIFDVHQNGNNSDDLYKQLQKAQSNLYIIRNLGRAFDEAIIFEQKKTNEKASLENRKKVQRNFEEERKTGLNHSVYEAPKSKILTSNEYYRNFLTKLTENHYEGCSCLNCKVFEVVTQNKKPKLPYEEYHKRMKTEIFQVKEEEFNADEEKIFQQPTKIHNRFDSDTSILIKESLKQKSLKENIYRKMNESMKEKNEEIENNSFYCNSIDLGKHQEYERNDSSSRMRNSKNGEKRIFYRRKVGLPPLNKKNQSIICQQNMFFKTMISNNNNIKRSISTGIPKRII